MRRAERMSMAAAALVALADCATSALDMAPDRADLPWTPVTTVTGEIMPGKKAAPDRAGGYVLPSNSSLAETPPPAIDNGKAYSLPELIDLAESNNPSTRIAWNDARRVALAAGIAESLYLPRITASAVGVYQGSSAHDTLSSINVSNNASGSGVISAVSLQWLLFDFGEREAILDAAKQASVISNIAFTAAHQQLIYNVSLAFYVNAAARAHLTAATQSLANAKAVQAAGEDRLRREIGTVIEVAQARQGTAQANLALVQATGGARDAYLGLISAIGISPLTKIKVADVAGRKLSANMIAPVESVISESLARRPDVLSAYAAKKASLANVRAAEAEFLPKFFLSATGAYNSGSLNVSSLPSIGQQSGTVNLNGNRVGGTILGGMTVPLYDGGTRAATLAQAHADADSADARLTRTRDDAVRQIVLADNALHTSLSAYEAAEALRAAAQTTFDATLAAYRAAKVRLLTSIWRKANFSRPETLRPTLTVFRCRRRPHWRYRPVCLVKHPNDPSQLETTGEEHPDSWPAGYRQPTRYWGGLPDPVGIPPLLPHRVAPA
jgi:outer membrane protein TolC